MLTLCLLKKNHTNKTYSGRMEASVQRTLLGSGFCGGSGAAVGCPWSRERAAEGTGAGGTLTREGLSAGEMKICCALPGL